MTEPNNDAQRVVDALADLFDDQAPRDRTAAEEELRAAGAVPTQVGDRIARRVSAVLPTTSSRSVLGAAGARRGAQRAAEPVRRRNRFATRLLPLLGAMAAAAVVAWVFFRPTQPAPIAMRVPVPGGVHSLPNRAPDAGLQRPHDGNDEPPISAEMAPGTSGTERHAQTTAPKAGGSAAGAQSGAAGDPWVDVGAAGVEDTGPMIAGADEEAWVLDHSNWEKGADLLPAPVLERVRNGTYAFLVQPMRDRSLATRYSPAFREASLQNAERFTVRAEDCSLHEGELGATPSNFFGFPFPTIAQKSSTAGCEIMWNVTAARAAAGGLAASVEFNSFLPGATQAARSLLALHSTAFVGGPSPFDNPEMLRWAQLVRMSTPVDRADFGTLTKRFNDPAATDKVWMFSPSLRRVRAVDPVNRSDSIWGSSIAPDELECFDGKLEDFAWNLVGTKTILAPMTGMLPSVQIDVGPTKAKVPLRRATSAYERPDAGGAPWRIVDNLLMVPRKVWVIEGTPRNHYYLYGRLQLFVDAALYRPYWLFSYSWQGVLVKNTMCTQHWSRSNDGTFASASATAVTSVDRETDATLGRYLSLTLDRGRPEDALYTIATMTERSH